jgi:hypothetical protein
MSDSRSFEALTVSPLRLSSSPARSYVASTPVDFRKGATGLTAPGAGRRR